jgi:hypothetical protein
MDDSEIDVGVLRTGVGEDERKGAWEVVAPRSFGDQPPVLSVRSSSERESRENAASTTKPTIQYASLTHLLPLIFLYIPSAALHKVDYSHALLLAKALQKLYSHEMTVAMSISAPPIAR